MSKGKKGEYEIYLGYDADGKRNNAALFWGEEAVKKQIKALYRLFAAQSSGHRIGYLFPLPFLKLIFEIIFPNTNLDFSSQIPKEALLISAQKNTMLYDGESYHLNPAFQFRLLTAFIWGAVVSAVILFRMFQYCRRKKAFMQCAAAASWEDVFLADRLAARYKVRRHIFLQKAQEKGDFQKRTKEAFTLGGFKPIIFYRNLSDGRDKEMVLHHEIIHIKRWDMAWRMRKFLFLWLRRNSIPIFMIYGSWAQIPLISI